MKSELKAEGFALKGKCLFCFAKKRNMKKEPVK
jgi:hypothetical protein